MQNTALRTLMIIMKNPARRKGGVRKVKNQMISFMMTRIVMKMDNNWMVSITMTRRMVMKMLVSMHRTIMKVMMSMGSRIKTRRIKIITTKLRFVIYLKTVNHRQIMVVETNTIVMSLFQVTRRNLTWKFLPFLTVNLFWLTLCLLLCEYYVLVDIMCLWNAKTTKN